MRPLLPLLFLLVLFGGCAPFTPLPHPIVEESYAPVKVGVLLPLTGADGDFGRRVLKGVNLAYLELNGSRGISGRKVELLVRDTKSDPLEARRQVDELFNAGIIGLVGPYSTREAMAVKPVCEAKLIPTVMPMVTADEATEGSRMIFRNSFTDKQQGMALACYAWFWRKLLRIGILVDNGELGEYSRNVARAASDAFEELGGEVVASAAYDGNQDAFLATLREMLRNGPQAILIPAEPAAAGKLVKFIREQGFNGLLLGPDSWDEPVFLKECGSQPGLCAFIGFYADEFDLPEQERFREVFRKEYFVYPTACEAQGYDALKFLAVGLGKVKSVEDFNRNMCSIRRTPGAAAIYTMLPGGEIDRTMFLKTVRPPAYPGGPTEARMSAAFDITKLQQLFEDN